MAFDRTINKTYIAEMIKADPDDQHQRELIIGYMKLIDYSAAEVAAASVATITSALTSAGL